MSMDSLELAEGVYAGLAGASRAHPQWAFRSAVSPEGPASPDIVLHDDVGTLAVGEIKGGGRAGDPRHLAQVVRYAGELDARWAFVVTPQNLIILDRSRPGLASSKTIANIDLAVQLESSHPQVRSRELGVLVANYLSAYVLRTADSDAPRPMYSTQVLDEATGTAATLSMLPIVASQDRSPWSMVATLTNDQAVGFPAEQLEEALARLMTAPDGRVVARQLQESAPDEWPARVGLDYARFALRLVYSTPVTFEASPPHNKCIAELLRHTPSSAPAYTALGGVLYVSTGLERTILLPLIAGIAIIDITTGWPTRLAAWRQARR